MLFQIIYVILKDLKVHKNGNPNINDKKTKKKTGATFGCLFFNEISLIPPWSISKGSSNMTYLLFSLTKLNWILFKYLCKMPPLFVFLG